jgi:hypothetical protein
MRKATKRVMFMEDAIMIGKVWFMLKGNASILKCLIPNAVRENLTAESRDGLARIFRMLCRYKSIELLEGYAMLDHV